MTRDGQTTAAPDKVCLRDAAQQRFAHDLPRLLHDHPNCWVAYHGDHQVAVARHSGELYDRCRQLQLSLEEVMLFEIASPDEEVILGPMAFD
jgi:hypothetical protein